MELSIPQAGLVVRTGAERATLVRRTYLLVLAGVILTMGGVAFTFSQPALLATVARHPFITMICAFIPLFMAMRARASFPSNIGLSLLFTFTMGVAISPVIYLYSQTQPQLIPQAGLLTLSTFSVLGELLRRRAVGADRHLGAQHVLPQRDRVTVVGRRHGAHLQRSVDLRHVAVAQRVRTG